MTSFGSRMLCALIVVPLVMALVPASISHAADRSEIVIGTSLALTGPMAAHGRDLKWAYELAASEANAQGGIFIKDSGKKLKVRLVFEDNASNPMKAAATVEKLVRVDKVNMLLGGAEPTCVIAACIAADKLKTLYHTAFGFPTAVWLEHKFKWSTDLFFSMDQFGIPFKLLDSIEKNERPKKVAIVTEATFSGDALAAALRRLAKAGGYAVAVAIRLPLGAQDYSPQISKVKQAGANAILLFASCDDTERLVRGLKKTNFNVPFIYSWKGAWSGKFWKDLGTDAQYIICDGFWSMDYPFPGAKELGEQYYKKFGEYSVSVGLPYALAKILFEAIEKAGTLDGAKVRQAVLTQTFNTVMGTVKYNEKGLALFPQIAAQWWDGKQMLVYPTKYAVWNLKLAPAWDKR